MRHLYIYCFIITVQLVCMVFNWPIGLHIFSHEYGQSPPLQDFSTIKAQNKKSTSLFSGYRNSWFCPQKMSFHITNINLDIFFKEKVKTQKTLTEYVTFFIA